MGLLLSLVLAPWPARAELVEQDLVAAGDRLLTFDTATGLEWLDVRLTLGHDYDQVLENDFVTAHRFRVATADKIAALWTHAGG